MHGGMNEELWLSPIEETRPQLELQKRVWDELRRDLETDSADVFVWVEDFVATLSGSVRSYGARGAVERGVVRVPGVRRVINELRVVLPELDGNLLPAP